MNLSNTLLTSLAATLFCAVASADTIDVQFYSAVATSGSLPTSYSGAAVVGASSDIWNPLSTATAHNVALENTAGGATPVQLSYTSAGLFNNPANENGFGGTPYQNLMDSYLYVNGASNVTSTTFLLTGLQADGSYSLYFYSEANSNGREMTIDLNGTSESTQAADSTLGQFVQGQNYLALTGTADSTGKISFTLSSPLAGGAFQQEADLNGFQLVGPNAVAPEPRFTGVVGGLVLLTFLWTLKRVVGPTQTGR